MKDERESDRVSLGQLDPVKALKALLAVDPDAPADEDGKQVPTEPPESDDGK